MARHSEEECGYCEGDVLPLSYIVGADEQLYCSVKCAAAGEKKSVLGKTVQPAAAASRSETEAVNVTSSIHS